MSTGSPGRITFKEILEVFFGYLVFTGFDKISRLVYITWFSKEDEKDSKTKLLLQLAAIILALIVLFRHKFVT